MRSLATSVSIALRSRSWSRSPFSVPAGYALARLRLPWRSADMISVPAAAGVSVRRDLHQRGAGLLQASASVGTITGVVLVHAAHGLVYSVWIAAAAFAAVDRDLELAARNLGASPAPHLRRP